jgi:hypothetical protein
MSAMRMPYQQHVVVAKRSVTFSETNVIAALSFDSKRKTKVLYLLTYLGINT